MIVSHSHRFIWVKAVKVAGTSIQKALMSFLEPGDVATTDMSRHLGADEVKACVSDEEWDEYTKIVSIRSPWDVLVSLYHFAHEVQRFNTEGFNAPACFDDFLWWHLSSNWNNKEFWMLDGGFWADVHIRFEHLELDFSDLMSKLNFQSTELERIDSPYDKGIPRQPRSHYSHYYSRWGKDYVAEFFQDEIEKFGYSFDHPFDVGGNWNWIR